MSEVVNSSLKTAVKGTVIVFFGTSAGIFLWFATKVLIVRNTSKEEFGIYSLALAAASILGIIANAGLQDGVTRYVSIFLGEDRRDDAAAVSKSALQIGLTLGLIASLCLYLFASPIAKHVFYMPEMITPLRVISFFCVFFVFSSVLVGILRGYGLINPRVYYINIGHPLFLLVFLGVVLVLGLSFIGIVYAYLLSIIAVCVSIGVYGYSKIGFNPLSLFGGRFGKDLFRFSLPLIGLSLAGMIFSWTDTFMLGRYMGAKEVGIYNVSMSLARLLTFAPNALNFVFLPIVGEMYSKKQFAELQRTYQVLTKWVFSATLPLFFILFFFPETTIIFLFEQRYVASSIPLQILSVGLMSTVFIGANMIILIIFGMSKQIFHISVIVTVLNVILNYIFIKRLGYGVVGASIATTISTVVGVLASAIFLYVRSRIHPLTAKYLRPVVGSAVIGLIIYAVAKSLPLYFWMLPIYFVLFVGGYVVSLLFSRSLDKEDLALFEAISHKTGFRMELVRVILNRFAQK